MLIDRMNFRLSLRKNQNKMEILIIICKVWMITANRGISLNFEYLLYIKFIIENIPQVPPPPSYNTESILFHI